MHRPTTRGNLGDRTTGSIAQSGTPWYTTRTVGSINIGQSMR